MKKEFVCVAAVCCFFTAPLMAGSGNTRSDVHQKYVAKLRDYVQNTDYRSWTQPEEFPKPGVGPVPGQVIFARHDPEWSQGSMLISEHRENGELTGISIFVKQKQGYSRRNHDWYWVHFAEDGTVISASPDEEPFRKNGFVSWEVEGRLWVFDMTSKVAADFARSGELAKNVTRPGAGPNRMTIRSSDSETIDAWVAARDGFVVKMEDGRLWVFRDEDPALFDFLSGKEPAGIVIRPGAGPNGETLKAASRETLAAYLATRDGFATFIVDGRIWVFQLDDPALETFRTSGEISRNVTRPGAGPDGMTVRAPDSETLDAYLN